MILIGSDRTTNTDRHQPKPVSWQRHSSPLATGVGRGGRQHRVRGVDNHFGRVTQCVKGFTRQEHAERTHGAADRPGRDRAPRATGICTRQFAGQIPTATFRGRIAAPAATSAAGTPTEQRKILCPNGIKLHDAAVKRCMQQWACKWASYSRTTNNESGLTIG